MPISPAKFVPYEAKTVLVRVYSYDSGNPVGALSNAAFEDDVAFFSLSEMILGIERILDALQFPQHNLETRSFRRDSAETAHTVDDGSAKSIATFKLNVLFRQNASWQGTLVWLEDKSEVQFRSVLELIQLLDSVLS